MVACQDKTGNHFYDMKYFLFTIFTILFFSCSNRDADQRNKPEPFKQASEKNTDTFNLRDLYTDSFALQKGISLKTIELVPNKKHLGISIEYPKLSTGEFPEVTKWVTQLISWKRKDFENLIQDEKVFTDTSFSQLPQGWGMWIRPVLLYKKNNTISFSLESGSGFTGMPSGFEFNTYNYDIPNKKEIKLEDYFLLNSKADSAFLEKIIQRCHNNSFSLKQNYGQLLHFAFDDHSVYFFFDKYDVLGWGISSVEKKYITDHIHPAYR